MGKKKATLETEMQEEPAVGCKGLFFPDREGSDPPAPLAAGRGAVFYPLVGRSCHFPPKVSKFSRVSPIITPFHHLLMLPEAI